MNERNERPVLFSGVRASGHLTIGNYFGSIRHWVALQDEYDCLLALVDLHTITERCDPAELRDRSYELLALYIACGIDPDKNTIFVQSHVPAHAELAWILNCFTYTGELRRMTQYKEKALRQVRDINAGLFVYPVLMAADILLYKTALVPVGEDQKQHLELTRDLARRFNSVYGQIFAIPKAYIPPVGARIMSLQEPTTKMSKSDENSSNYVALLDPPDVVRRKIQRAVTDPGREVAYDESKPGISNLIEIFSCITGESLTELQVRYKGRGYAEFKRDLGDALVDLLSPIQSRCKAILEDRRTLREILKRGACAASGRARLMLETVHRVLGFISR